MALINLRNAMMVAGKPLLSMRKEGSVSPGFIITNLGTATLPQTVTCWYKFAAYSATPDIWAGKAIVKFGNMSSGMAYGMLNYPGIYSDRAALNEGKYWSCYRKQTSQSYPDTQWHHLAMVVRSGTYPTKGTVYVDGTAYTTGTDLKSTALTTPTGHFSILGRQNDDGYPAVVLAHRVCVFDSQLSDAEVAADMALGATPSSRSDLVHYWDGTVDNAKLVDLVGTWNLTFSDGCSIVQESPWS